jgi:hypothetical protein
MDKRRRAELLEQVARANKTVREAKTIDQVVEGMGLLCEIAESMIREMGPSAHAEGWARLQATPGAWLCQCLTLHHPTITVCDTKARIGSLGVSRSFR